MFVVIHNPPKGTAKIIGPFVSAESAAEWVMSRGKAQRKYYVWTEVEKPQ